MESVSICIITGLFYTVLDPRCYWLAKMSVVDHGKIIHVITFLFHSFSLRLSKMGLKMS